ncbi:MAG: GGDEF domain-containing protein [Bilifractor sp.]
MRAFLGRRTKSEVIGKTAGDLGLFVDPEDLKTENERALKSGEVIRFSPLMVSDGISRRVPVTEFPWYHGNQIYGTAGWIHIGEGLKEQSFITDSNTGFLDEYGGLLAGSAYADAYQRSGQEYFAVYLALRSADSVNHVFGNAFFDKIVSAAADRLRQGGFPEGTTIVHLQGFRFLMIGMEKHGGVLLDAVKVFQRTMQNLREIDGVECYLKVDCSMASGSEAEGFADLLRILEERMHRGGQNMEKMEEYHAMHHNLMVSPELLDTSPERIMLIDPENNDILFMNKAMKRDLNLPDNYSESGEKCYTLLNGRNTPCTFCQNSTMCFNLVKSGRARFHANGSAYVTREIMIRWKGRMARMVIGILDEAYSDVSSARDLLNDELWANQSITSGMEEKNPSTGIQKTVSQIAWNLQAERFLVFEERSNGTVCCTYEWCIEGKPSLKEELQSVLIEKLKPLYRMFETNKMVMIPDYEAFCGEHPDFWLPVDDIRNVVSGHFMISGRSTGFTLVLNAFEETFHQKSIVLATLTDFLAVMIQNRKNIEEALEQSMRDPMTGVLNRAGLTRYLQRQSQEESVAVISGDINGLKAMNDHHGHLAGDRLIRSITAILVRFSDVDHVFRVGGDEFLMIREGMDDAGVRELIRQIKDTCRTKGLSIALGYTIHRGKLDDIDAVVRQADQAMYDDKGHFYHRRRTD